MPGVARPWGEGRSPYGALQHNELPRHQVNSAGPVHRAEVHRGNTGYLGVPGVPDLQKRVKYHASVTNSRLARFTASHARDCNSFSQQAIAMRRRANDRRRVPRGNYAHWPQSIPHTSCTSRGVRKIVHRPHGTARAGRCVVPRHHVAARHGLQCRLPHRRARSYRVGRQRRFRGRVCGERDHVGFAGVAPILAAYVSNRSRVHKRTCASAPHPAAPYSTNTPHGTCRIRRPWLTRAPCLRPGTARIPQYR